MTVLLNDLVPSLQIAIGPAILVSGVGLLLLSMTNRIARVIDRSHELATEGRSVPIADPNRIGSQLDILTRRAALLRLAITLTVASLLSAAILIITLFAGATLGLEVGVLVVVLFGACMLALIGGLIAFLRDVNLSLAALTLDLRR